MIVSFNAFKAGIPAHRLHIRSAYIKRQSEHVQRQSGGVEWPMARNGVSPLELVSGLRLQRFGFFQRPRCGRSRSGRGFGRRFWRGLSRRFATQFSDQCRGAPQFLGVGAAEQEQRELLDRLQFRVRRDLGQRVDVRLSTAIGIITPPATLFNVRFP